jgi:hypothetical protein
METDEDELGSTSHPKGGDIDDGDYEDSDNGEDYEDDEDHQDYNASGGAKQDELQCAHLLTSSWI